MGEYNPHSPYILGEELVTIRDENLQINPLITTGEFGSTFSLETATTVNHARFYINTIPTTTPVNQFYTIQVYPRGSEEEWGPLRSVIIPVDAVTVSGGFSTIGSPSGGAAALLSPLPDYYYTADFNDVSALMWISFNVAQYSPLLDGKRIVAVNVLLGAGVEEDANPPLFGVTDQTGAGATINHLQYSLNVPQGSFDAQMSRIRLGGIAPYSAVTLATAEYSPWIYNDVAKFDASSGSRIFFAVGFGSLFGNTASLVLWYAGLEVVYCDETRVAVGTNSIGQGSGDNTQTGPNWGANVARMRSWQAKALNPSLPAGDYVVTMSSVESYITSGADDDTSMGFNAVRLGESLYTHQPIELEIPYPPEENLETEITSVYTTVIPQISLHASGGTNLTQLQVYGRTAAAKVYGAITATQSLTDTGVAAGSYPWVRFYARRFQGTTSPLTIVGSGGLAASYAAITVDEFDDLDEIVDGWKEISLRFDTAPTMGGVTPSWVFSAANENAQTRWEVLAAAAPAISGLPGDLYGQAPNQLYNGTYNPPAGATADLTWMPQGVNNIYTSSSTADQGTDAVVFFGQDSPTITGMALEVVTQAVSGIGLDCGLEPCGIPTGIDYMELTWMNSANGYHISEDDFTTSGADWGSLTTGQAWTESGAAFTRSGGYGLVSSANGVTNTATVDMGSPDQDVRILFNVGTLPGTSLLTQLNARYTNATNRIYLQASVDTADVFSWVACELYVAATSGGAILTQALRGQVLDLTHWYGMRLQVSGPRVRAKFWDNTVEEEPEEWQVDFNQSRLTTGNLFAVQTLATTTNAVVVSFDGLMAMVGAPVKQFGFYELQRSDDLTDWQTIMTATDSFVTGFNDYEARIGLETSYRIRIVDVHGFYGDWSAELSDTIESPGLDGGCLDNAHVLVLTTNQVQDGSSNLAYSSIWTGTVEEGFAFPEAGQVTFQQMYGRDFQTAFHPTERGGVVFQREVLVQAAAIAAPTLENFTGLRDLAWADLDYVCLRDEDGNRWFMSVQVPDGKVQLYRKLYMASLQFVQVTDTPTQVNP